MAKKTKKIKPVEEIQPVEEVVVKKEKLDLDKEVNYLREVLQRYKDLCVSQPCLANTNTVHHIEKALGEQIHLRGLRK
jgi:hypothetical protein